MTSLARAREQGKLFQVNHILSRPRPTTEPPSQQCFDASEGIRKEANDYAENKHCLTRIYLEENEREEVFNNSLGTSRCT